VTADSSTIPVLRPLLPSAERLAPYLRRIDETRIYTNWGPLVIELEGRLCGHFGLEGGAVVSAGSGTAALTGAILARAGRATAERPVALVPAFTFVATAIAVEQCGYDLYLADVDPESWMLDPDRVAALDLDRVGLVVPVAPFGRSVPQEPWRSFSERTGIPVVIDGAASFECVGGNPDAFLGEIPVAMSFHATKSFSTAEGGCVVCSDLRLSHATMKALNFGFHDSRDSELRSINGKLSEYHAAIGLAELDGWTEKQAAIEVMLAAYRRAFAAAGLSDRLVATPDVASAYVLFRCESAAEAARTGEQLSKGSIDFRIWYGGGLHAHTYLAGCAREDLPVTDDLAPRILGLPMAPDLPEASIRRVVEALVSAVQR
jgi:dTDP-4-amino-4,6-dideoxygalactose transaminase